MTPRTTVNTTGSGNTTGTDITRDDTLERILKNPEEGQLKEEPKVDNINTSPPETRQTSYVLGRNPSNIGKQLIDIPEKFENAAITG